MKLSASKNFERKYKKLASKNSQLKSSIDQTLLLMEQDAFNPILETHKLTGKLIGLWAISCGYDCRIIFTFQKSMNSDEQIILLVDFGTHKEVY